MRRILILVGIALILTSTVFAANTGRLKGQCLTSDGEALPGVTVQITSEVLIGGPQVAISGADGEFSFNLLAVGDYTVQGSLAGFRSAAGTVRVSADATGSVALYMIPEQFGGEIEVLAEVPVVDTSQVNTRQVWGEDYLKYATVGTANRSYQKLNGAVSAAQMRFLLTELLRPMGQPDAGIAPFIVEEWQTPT